MFHKLRNVGDNIKSKSHRKEMLQAAAAIYDAQQPQEAHQRLEQFATRWAATEPEAVASLRLEFAASVAYLEPLGIPHPERYRTTNAIEGGVMRPLRRRLDAAGRVARVVVSGPLCAGNRLLR